MQTNEIFIEFSFGSVYQIKFSIFYLDESYMNDIVGMRKVFAQNVSLKIWIETHHLALVSSSIFKVIN